LVIDVNSQSAEKESGVTQGDYPQVPDKSSRQAARLLIVEDDPDISCLLVYILENAGYHTTAVADCNRAWHAMSSSRPDLILLDWMLPDMSGVDFLRRLRGHSGFSDLAVIMVTARSEEADRVRGLEGGADDYIVKPFSNRELCARVSVRLRAIRANTSSTLLTAGLSLDQRSYRVTVGDSSILLGPTEFRLLRYFMKNIDRVLTRGQLLDSVWGANVYIEERTVDVHIRRLRKALEPCQKDDLIQTVRGTGYRFSGQSG